MPIEAQLLTVRPIWPASWAGLYLVVAFASVLSALAFTVLNSWAVLLGVAWLLGRRKDALAGWMIIVTNLIGLTGACAVPRCFFGRSPDEIRAATSYAANQIAADL